MGRCPRLTRAEGSEAAAELSPLTPPSRITAPPPHLNGEELKLILLWCGRHGFGHFGWTPGLRGDRHRDELRVVALERQRDPALDQRERVLAEDVVAPAVQHMDVALAGGQAVDLVGARHQACRDAGLLRLEPQQGA